ncbi:hypothetical protein [Streptomyces sp. NPDC045251]|uniref:hypothetical protein n=1 Tax=unclassified Streptomyces TaxID=2593676 RepID=UPI0033CC39BA
MTDTTAPRCRARAAGRPVRARARVTAPTCPVRDHTAVPSPASAPATRPATGGDRPAALLVARVRSPRPRPASEYRP